MLNFLWGSDPTPEKCAVTEREKGTYFEELIAA